MSSFVGLHQLAFHLEVFEGDYLPGDRAPGTVLQRRLALEYVRREAGESPAAV